MEWGTYTEGGGGDFVTELEKLTYIAQGTTLFITGVREGAGQYGPQWYVDFTDAAGEDKTISFKKGTVERDDRVTRIADTIAASSEPVKARLLKIGRRYDLGAA